MSFRDEACAHLSTYRETILGIADEGMFNYRGIPHPKGHILPDAFWQHNLMPPYRDLFFASEHGSLKRHQYFHHLNSSQALCINLFYPLIREDELSPLIGCIGADIALPAQVIFESPSEIEVAQRRTAFDFHIRSQQGKDLFVEVKYTEDGFGRADADAEHLDKFRVTYAPLLAKSAFLAPHCSDPEFFLANYQVLRNLVHITPCSQVLFLFPRANLKVAEQAAHARETFLTDRGRERMLIVFLEDLVPQLISSFRGTRLEGYYEAFRGKYLDFCH